MHLLAQSQTGDLSGIIRDFKHYTSGKILEELEGPVESRKDWLKMIFEFHAKFKNKQDFQIWTHENHGEQIYSQKFIEQKLDYIHNNPVRAGIVLNPEDYIYSSASNYADQESLIDVIRLDLKWKTI